MTEEAPKITSAMKTPREKNPGRVAAGKRLAAISKEAKERKKLERENVIIRDQYDPFESIHAVRLVGGAFGLIVVARVALYFLSSERTEESEGTAGSERTEGREARKATEGTEGTAGSKQRREEPKRTEGRERPKRSFQAYSIYG